MSSHLRSAAIAISAGRVALGAALVVVPERIGRGWIGPAATERSVEVLARSLGIRDVVVGAGGAAALLGGSDSARAWLIAAAVADIGDLFATLLARDVLPANGVRGTAVLAAGSAAICSATAAQI